MCYYDKLLMPTTKLTLTVMLYLYNKAQHVIKVFFFIVNVLTTNNSDGETPQLDCHIMLATVASCMGSPINSSNANVKLASDW